MANEKMPGIPSLPGDNSTWTAFVDQFETLKKGDAPVSLTEWATGNTTLPAIAAGSAIEIAGGTFRFTAQTPIDKASAPDGTVYVIIETSSDNALPKLTATAPTWRDDLNGWYNAGGDGRYTGHIMTQVPAGYQDKGRFDNEKTWRVSRIERQPNAVSGNLTPAAGSIILPAGTYYFRTSSGDGVRIEANVEGTWQELGRVFVGLTNYTADRTIVSDGTNYRLRSPAFAYNYSYIWVLE